MLRSELCQKEPWGGSWWRTRTNELNIREQCVCSEESLTHIREDVSSVLGEVVVLLCLELMRLHLEYSVDCSPPSLKKAQTRRSRLNREYSVTEGPEPVLCEERCGGKMARLSSTTVMGGIEKVELCSSRRCVMKA